MFSKKAGFVVATLNVLARAGLCCASVAIAAFSDTIVLKDGRRISGAIDSADLREIRIRMASRVQSLPVIQIQSISFENSTPAAAMPAISGRPESSLQSFGEGPETRLQTSSAPPRAANPHPVPTGSSTVPAPYSGPLSGTVSCPGQAIVQNGEVVFENLPPGRLRLIYDASAWESSLVSVEGRRQRLILRNKKPGTQKKCEVRWDVVQ